MSQKEDTEEERANWHWRNSMRPVRFFGLDVRAGIPLFILLFYLRPVTLALVVISTTAFMMMEKRGLSFDASMRSVRTWLLGQKRTAWLKIRRRRMVDFG